jgi:hypothetical protein
MLNTRGISTADLVDTHDVKPSRCDKCKSRTHRMNNYTAGNGEPEAIWQCEGCNRFTSRSRASVIRQIRNMENGTHPYHLYPR